MATYVGSFMLLAAALVTASPVDVKRDTNDPSGSVLPTPTSFPVPTADASSGTAGASKFEWKIWAKYDGKSKEAVIKTWEDSKQFSDALAKWILKGDYQVAMDMYMGTRSTYSDLLGYNFRRQIQNK